MRKYKVKSETHQVYPDEHFEDADSTDHAKLRSGSLHPAANVHQPLSAETIRMAIVKARYLRSRAFRKALVTFVQGMMKLIRSGGDALRKVAEGRRTRCAPKTSIDRRSGDAGSDRKVIASVIKSGRLKRAGTHQKPNENRIATSCESDPFVTARETSNTDPVTPAANRHLRRTG